MPPALQEQPRTICGGGAVGGDLVHCEGRKGRSWTRLKQRSTRWRPSRTRPRSRPPAHRGMSKWRLAVCAEWKGVGEGKRVSERVGIGGWGVCKSKKMNIRG